MSARRGQDEDVGYLSRAAGGGFSSVPGQQQRYEEPSYLSSPQPPNYAGSAVEQSYRPSEIYGRPSAPSEVWNAETDTIHPGDSVSQLGRNNTAKRPMGPRPLETVAAMSPVREESINEQDFQYVPPHMLEDDRSTVLQGDSRQQRAVPSRAGSGRTGDSHQSQGIYPVGAPREYPNLDDHYTAEDEDDAAYSHGHQHTGSSAQAPLVPGAAAYAGARSAHSSNQPSGFAPAGGYAGVAGQDEEDDPYSAYATRKLGDDVEQGYGKGGQAWSSPFSYFDQKDSYPPTPATNDKAFTRESGADPRTLEAAPYWRRALWIDSTPDELREYEHKQGLGIQRWPVACWALTVIMTGIMIYELVHMDKLTGSPIQTKPSFNVMIGPSGSVLINLGARFDGCIKYVSNITNLDWTCLSASNSATVTTSDASCTMSDICGWGGWTATEQPHQRFRFVTPIFLHAGVVHLILNMFAQCVSAAIIEKMMGTPKFLVLYFVAGIFGFILGGNFALEGQPSVGASGAIFAANAAILVDLIAHWGIEYRPKRKLVYLILELIIGLALGLVPGVDNFSHIGGFAMGLLFSILLLPIIHPSRRHRIITWSLRAIALPAAVVLYVVLVKNFYTDDPAASCSWCRYLSCWPTSSNNHCSGTGLSEVSTTGSFDLGSIVATLASTFLIPLLL